MRGKSERGLKQRPNLKSCDSFVAVRQTLARQAGRRAATFAVHKSHDYPSSVGAQFLCVLLTHVMVVWCSIVN